MSVNREGLVPVEKLEKLEKEIEQRCDATPATRLGSAERYGYTFVLTRIRALLAEAREEGKPLEKSEGQKATEWSQRPTREWEPPASAGTEGPGL